ncbi:MAG TPA: hypothetical protein VJV75_13335 [Candidatus Polarisedimenticolia bacterium]|nr:hypothetical protein [Candidatus Polarisedimenticolia bacterium]
MSIFTPDPDKNDGDIIFGSTWNSLKNKIASFINGGLLGDINISSNPSERIAGSKILLGSGGGSAPADAHAARHAPGGADELNDLDIGNTGTPVSAHHARHEEGGADAIAANSLNFNVIKAATLPPSVTGWRKQQESFAQNALGLTANPKYPRVYALTNSGADLTGRGVVRGGNLYMGSLGSAPDSVLKINIDAGTETVISLGANDAVKTMLLIGTNIYVLVGGATTAFVKKIDSNDVVTTVVDLNSGSAPNDLFSARTLRCNHDGTVLYGVIGNASTLYFFSVNVDGSSLLKVSSGGGTALYGLCYGKRGSEEKLWTIQNTATNNTILRRNVPALTADASFNTGTGANCRGLIFDGENLIVGVSGGAISHWVVDPWDTMQMVSQISNPSTIDGGGQVDDLDIEALRDVHIFDGRAAHFAGRQAAGTDFAAVLSIYPAEGYRAIARRVSIASVSPSFPGAIAMDNDYLYVAFSASGTPMNVRRMLRD